MTMGYDYDDPRREAMKERLKVGLCSSPGYYRDRRKALGGPGTVKSNGGRFR